MSLESRKRLGFIGLGSQGAPIAERMLKAGHDIAVWARRPEATADLAASGASVASSVEELGATCDYVGVCVVDDAGIKDVCARLIPAMKRGSVLVIHSTILPSTCEELDKRCAGHGILFLDAPVSGGGPAASAGTLTVMCGGTEEAFNAALPVLETFGGKIVLLGPAGAGQQAKIINNSLMAAHMGLAFHALEIAEEIGVDRKALGDLVNHSSGRSFGFEVFARLPSPAAFEHGGNLLLKDVNLLGSISGRDAADNPLAVAALPFLSAACANKDH